MKKLLLLLILISCSTTRDENTPKNKSLNYDDLIQLFNDWRNFENPPLLDGAPNYTKERFDNDQNKFIKLRERLNSFYTKRIFISNKIFILSLENISKEIIESKRKILKIMI